MPAKMARSAPRPPFGAPTVTAVVRAASPSCQNAAKAQKFTPVRGSSGESRLIRSAISSIWRTVKRSANHSTPIVRENRISG